jgi:Flp pilus assembly pilin Flp
MAREFLRTLHCEDDGQDVIEYAVLAAFLSIAAIALIKLVGPQAGTLFAKVKESLPEVPTTAASAK